jgi:hypothetical protein
MGTNYYLHENVCEHCGRGDGRPLHIGKSSGGWCFGLHVGEMISAVHDFIRIDGLDDWEELWSGPGAVIKDEYGDPCDPVDMKRIILERSSSRRERDYPNKWYASEDDFNEQNHAEPGPNGLSRHKIDGNHCIGHGNGTYDLITGEFS